MDKEHMVSIISIVTFQTVRSSLHTEPLLYLTNVIGNLILYTTLFGSEPESKLRIDPRSLFLIKWEFHISVLCIWISIRFLPPIAISNRADYRYKLVRFWKVFTCKNCYIQSSHYHFLTKTLDLLKICYLIFSSSYYSPSTYCDFG